MSYLPPSPVTGYGRELTHLWFKINCQTLGVISPQRSSLFGEARELYPHDGGMAEVFRMFPAIWRYHLKGFFGAVFAVSFLMFYLR